MGNSKKPKIKKRKNRGGQRLARWRALYNVGLIQKKSEISDICESGEEDRPKTHSPYVVDRQLVNLSASDTTRGPEDISEGDYDENYFIDKTKTLRNYSLQFRQSLNGNRENKAWKKREQFSGFIGSCSVCGFQETLENCGVEEGKLRRLKDLNWAMKDRCTSCKANQTWYRSVFSQGFEGSARKNKTTTKRKQEDISLANESGRPIGGYNPDGDGKKCSLTTGASDMLQVEFTPEMWEDKSEDTQERKVEEVIKVKRGRGRPKKKPIVDENVHVNGNSTSTGIFSESVACCALACPNTSDTHVMNRLPEESSLHQMWVKKIDRLAWVPDVDSALCEIHFDSDMWDKTVGGEKSLKPDAIPTLFLHGEAIKSWVTLDSNMGNIEKLGLSNEENGVAEREESDWLEEVESVEGIQPNDEQMVEDLFVKQEALEPEIDMVEGSEEVLSVDTNQRQFETIFCDSTFPDQQHNSESKRTKHELENVGDSLENPLSPETIYIDDQSESNQSEETNEEKDSFKVNISDVKSLQGEENDNIFYEVESQAFKDRTRARRRSSSQLTNEFECPICERRLSRRKNLEIHIKKLHPNGELTGNQKRIKLMKEEESKKQSDQQHPCFSVLAPPPSPPLSKAVQPVEASTVVTPPSSALGEMKKQFVLLVPNKVPEPPPPVLPTTDGLMINVNVATVPPEKRLALRIKLKELVDAVIHKNLDPERIIIAYDGT